MSDLFAIFTCSFYMFMVYRIHGIQSNEQEEMSKMPKKIYSKTGNSCRINFELPEAVRAKKASIVGDFNKWNPKAHPMKQKKDGSFYVTVYLQSGNTYRYRFLLDGRRWENDWNAEEYRANNLGSEDSIITV